jgi:hypothetical protein
MKTKYVMKTDDDTFVRIDGVQAAYQKRNMNHNLWLGLMEFSSVPHRDPSSKWYVRIEVCWPKPTHPPRDFHILITSTMSHIIVT